MNIPNITSTISKVTVFREGASVLRQAVISPTDNGSFPETIKLGNLPLTLDDGSLRVKIEGKGEGTPPVASDVRVMLEVVDNDPDLPPPTNEAFEEAERKTQRLKAELAAVERACMRLQRIDVNCRPEGEEGKPPPETPVEARLALIAFRTKQVEEHQAKVRQLEEEIRKAEEIESDLRARHERATSARQARENELRKTAVVSLYGENKDCEEATILLEYQVPGARWAPTYSVKFDKSYDSGKLSMRAVVAQKTGEEWTNVDLALSTADRHSFTELPELKSIRIGKRQPEPAKAGWRPPPVGTGELFSDFDKGFAALPSAPQTTRHPAKPKPQKAPKKELVAPPKQAPMDGPDDFYCPPPEAEPAPMEGAFGGGAMPPPAPPGGPPMPMMAAAPCQPSAPKMSRAGSIVDGMFNMVSEAVAAAECEKSVARTPCATGAAPRPRLRAKKKGKRAKMDHRDRRESTTAPVDIDMEDEFTPGDLLDYGRLRMAGAQSNDRGKLRPSSRRDIYLELLSELNVRVTFDVMQTIRVAINAAGSPQQQSLPAHCAQPSSYDNFAHIFAADEKVDVPSDGQFHSLPLFSKDADVSLKYVVVPRVTSDAFRMVTFRNPMDAPLLAGPADITVGDEYLLTTRFNTSAPKGKVELGLGVEQGIKVARNTSYDETESGLLIGELCLHHEIKVEVANMLKKDATVEVRERIPYVAKNEKEIIQVETVSVEPPWEKYEQSRQSVLGGYHWELTLAAGEEKTLKAEYEIHLPAKYELVGGNRREA